VRCLINQRNLSSLYLPYVALRRAFPARNKPGFGAVMLIAHAVMKRPYFREGGRRALVDSKVEGVPAIMMRMEQMWQRTFAAELRVLTATPDGGRLQ
jgi:hypothetical protein